VSDVASTNSMRNTKASTPWFPTTIGQVCKISTGKLDVNASIEGGQYPFFTCAERIYKIDQYAFDTEAILFAGNGDFNVKYYKGKFNAYQRTYVLHDLALHGRFMYHYVAHRISKITGGSRGSTIKYIRLADLRDHPIWIPEPEIQQKIVDEIETQLSRLEAAIANLKRVKANLKRYKAAVLKAAVEGRLVPTEAELAKEMGRTFETGAELLQRVLDNRRLQWSGRGKYIEPLSVEAPEPFAIPEGWTWASTDQLSDFVTKGTTPASTKLFDGKGAVQFLKVYNLTFDGSLNAKHKPAYIDRETHEVELARSKVRAGDVLINIVGPPLGQVAMVPEALAEANINQAIARIRPIEPLDPKFIAIMLMCREIMQWAIRRAKTTAGQSNLTLELCRALPLPLPPLTEQHRIVTEIERRLSLLRGVEEEVNANLQRADALRQSTLTAAFQSRTWEIQS